MAALLLVAACVGLSNLAASIGIGAGGADRAAKVRVAVVFGLLEAGMPVFGLLIGHEVAASVGHQARWLAAGLLVAVGGYGIVAARRAGGSPGELEVAGRGPSLARIIVSGVALSVDNLVAGFALGTYHVDIVAGAITFGLVSTVMSLAGLELGGRIGRRAGEHGELIGGVVLVGVGVAIGAGVLG